MRLFVLFSSTISFPSYLSIQRNYSIWSKARVIFLYDYHKLLCLSQYKPMVPNLRSWPKGHGGLRQGLREDITYYNFFFLISELLNRFDGSRVTYRFLFIVASHASVLVSGRGSRTIAYLWLRVTYHCCFWVESHVPLLILLLRLTYHLWFRITIKTFGASGITQRKHRNESMQATDLSYG